MRFGLRQKPLQNKFQEVKKVRIHGYAGHISSFSRYHGYSSMLIKGLLIRGGVVNYLSVIGWSGYGNYLNF